MKRFLMAAIGLAGCNPNDAGPGIPTSSFYAGPSEWTAQVGPTATTRLLHFPSLGVTTADWLVNASDTTSGGVTSLTVTSSAGDAPAEGATGSAVEASGALYTFVLDPTVRPPVLTARACPLAKVSSSFVVLQPPTSWTIADAIAGTFTYDPASGIAAETRVNASGDDVGANELGAGTCAIGAATLSSTAELYSGSDGLALVHEPTDGSIALALPTPSDAVALDAFDGSFVGTFYDGTKSAIVSVDNGVVQSSGTMLAQLSLTALGATNGTATGRLTIGATSAPVRCVMSTIDSTIVACAAPTISSIATLVLVQVGSTDTTTSDPLAGGSQP